MGSQRLGPGRHWEGRRARPQREALRPVCRRVATATAGTERRGDAGGHSPGPAGGQAGGRAAPTLGARARGGGGGSGEPEGRGGGWSPSAEFRPWRNFAAGGAAAGEWTTAARGQRAAAAAKPLRTAAGLGGGGEAPASPGSGPLRDRPGNPGSGTEKRPHVTRNDSLLTGPSQYRDEAQRLCPGGASRERWGDDPAVSEARRKDGSAPHRPEDNSQK